MQASNVIGLEGYMSLSDADELAAVLTLLWRNNYGQEPRDLDTDLDLCYRWFNPVAQGQRLRRQIEQLDGVEPGMRIPDPPLVVVVGSGRYLVTPEGRCVLDLLDTTVGDEKSPIRVSEEIGRYERRLAVLYRNWARHRLDSVIALLAGEERPLQIPAAGVVIALLVNRSTSRERAMARFTEDPPRRVVDDAFFACVSAFADVIAPDRRQGSLSSRLISGWMLYEVRRRLGGSLVLEPASEGPDEAVWIAAQQMPQVCDIVCRDLTRGHRVQVEPAIFGKAFDALVVELRRNSSALAGYGLAHERPHETTQLGRLMKDRIQDYCEPS